ncbi:hypothetical protein IMY05_016G0173300 [Salix suchowensis]|nr:hypothetical protein IMY05_016G0173300 [Salix suchowensis]
MTTEIVVFVSPSIPSALRVCLWYLSDDVAFGSSSKLPDFSNLKSQEVHKAANPTTTFPRERRKQGLRRRRREVSHVDIAQETGFLRFCCGM